MEATRSQSKFLILRHHLEVAYQRLKYERLSLCSLKRFDFQHKIISFVVDFKLSIAVKMTATAKHVNSRNF